MGIAGVQARVMELQSALGAVSQPSTTTTSAGQPSTTTSASQFSSVLASQLGGQSAASAGQAAALGGQPAGQWPLDGVSAPLATALTGGATGAGLSGASPPATPGTGAALVESAKKYLGVPYVWGGESLAEGGLDCSGLVQLAMKDIGVDVPRVAREQMRIGAEVPSLDQARPGDLVVTRGGGHIGIYAGGNKWIHAPYPGENVKLAEMTTTPTTIRRVLPS